jgi:hypothetical protein
VVLAGGGPDVVYDVDSTPDRLDGGGGANVLSLYPRIEPAVVDLRVPSTGDGDAISGFDDVAGGIGDDLLIGHEGDNRLFGESGEDELFGGAGQDFLEGGGGFDSFDGGPGWDRISATGTSHDYDSITHGSVGFDAVMEPIACGGGPDDVAGSFGDVIGADCEWIGKGFPARPVAVRGRRATFRIPCYARGCRGTLRVVEPPASSYRSGADPQTRYRIKRRTGRVTVRLDSPYCTCRSYEVTVVRREYRNRSISSWILPEERRPLR